MDIIKARKQALEVHKKNANDFEIFRDGQSVGFVKAFVCSSKYPNTIQTLEATEIYDGDILKFLTKNYVIVDAKPVAHGNELLYFMLKYATTEQSNIPKHHSETHNYNFNAPISGTNVIGSHDFTLNVDNSIKNIQDIINNKTVDKEALQELLDEIKETSENNTPLTKGIFSKFSDLLAKHSDIAIAIGTFLTTMFFGK